MHCDSLALELGLILLVLGMVLVLMVLARSFGSAKTGMPMISCFFSHFGNLVSSTIEEELNPLPSIHP